MALCRWRLIYSTRRNVRCVRYLTDVPIQELLTFVALLPRVHLDPTDNAPFGRVLFLPRASWLTLRTCQVGRSSLLHHVAPPNTLRSDAALEARNGDALTGGAGNDVFVFNTAPNSTMNLDRITDFSARDDTILAR